MLSSNSIALFGCLLLCGAPLALTAQTFAAGEDVSVKTVQPSMADPGLKTEFDDPSVALLPRNPTHTELVVFLPGTHGKPRGSSDLLRFVAAAGFRTIGLMYNDVPSEAEVCSKGTDVGCSGKFREERVAGDASDAVVQNTSGESIIHRLASVLLYLEKTDPGKGWGAYVASGQPVWERIIISGHSQGGGHAAYIGRFHKVARVVCFSGPADGIDLRSKSPQMSSWLKQPSATPMDRWYAEYHEKEGAAPILAMAYKTLGIPANHTRLLHLEAADAASAKPAYYHVGTVNDPRNLPDWRFLFGIDGEAKN